MHRDCNRRPQQAFAGAQGGKLPEEVLMRLRPATNDTIRFGNNRSSHTNEGFIEDRTELTTPGKATSALGFGHASKSSLRHPSKRLIANRAEKRAKIRARIPK
jgi:hypothetical protein